MNPQDIENSLNKPEVKKPALMYIVSTSIGVITLVSLIAFAYFGLVKF